MLINGEPADSVSALDRGLAYGDGLFETIRVLEGKPLLFEKHMSRLRDGCHSLGIVVDFNEVEHDVRQVLSDNEQQDAILKIVLTRGRGRGYSPDLDALPTRIVSISEYQADADAWRQGIRAMMCETRLALNPRLAGIKHLNRLEQVMAAGELGDDVVEGLMMNYRDEVIEGTRTNLFLVEQGRLVTPDLGESGVRGTLRQFLLEHLPASVEPVSLPRLLGAEEVFVCNSVVGIWPVVSLLNGDTVGEWPSGPVTRSAQALLTEQTGMRN